MPKKRKKQDIDINLIPKDPFFETGVGKTLKWALSVGRYIVIFTELVVIISFVTRFSLDRQVTDLNEKIFQKQTIIESYGDLEENVREVQERIKQYNQIKQQSNIVDVFPQISAITPSDIRLDQLIIKTDSIVLNGTSFSNNTLNTLINNIQLSDAFSDIVIDKIETGDSKDPGFHFSIQARTKEQQSQEIQKKQELPGILDRTQGYDNLNSKSN